MGGLARGVLHRAPPGRGNAGLPAALGTRRLRARAVPRRCPSACRRPLASAARTRRCPRQVPVTPVPVAERPRRFGRACARLHARVTLGSAERNAPRMSSCRSSPAMWARAEGTARNLALGPAAGLARGRGKGPGEPGP